MLFAVLWLTKAGGTTGMSSDQAVLGQVLPGALLTP